MNKDIIKSDACVWERKEYINDIYFKFGVQNLIWKEIHCNKCMDPDSEQIRMAVSSALPSVTRNCWREAWCELERRVMWVGEKSDVSWREEWCELERRVMRVGEKSDASWREEWCELEKRVMWVGEKSDVSWREEWCKLERRVMWVGEKSDVI